MPWGLYRPATKEHPGGAVAASADGPGAASDPQARKHEVWARIRFEGPAFLHGTPGGKDAISVERVVLVLTEG